MIRTLQEIRRLLESENAGELTDRQLLERFATRRDESAFALLVRRHGPMVLRVCLRVLRHRHDAEDAFQATFLVLARKASSICWHSSAGGWLFRVAYHLALKMRTRAGRRRAQALPDVAVTDGAGETPHWELRSILDEELNRLPEKYRAPLILCHCEGKSRAEAARQLGWKEGAVKIRLERGRELLRARLTRRGLELSSLVVGELLAVSPTDAAVPAALVDATVGAAQGFVLGELPAAAASQSAAVLAEGVLKAMMRTRLKAVAVVLLVVCAASLGVGLWAHRAFGDKPKDAPPPRQEVGGQRQTPGGPAQAKPEKPLRVLLFAGGPTREYQFVRSVFVNQVDRKKAELSICLQTGAAPAGQDVPPERLLKRFPSRWSEDTKDNGENKYDNLGRYDVVIAFDPDWTQLTEEQGKLLNKWVAAEGHGLILVAGPLNTFQLVRPGITRAKVKPLLELYPVVLQDIRIQDPRDTSNPWPLTFPVAEKFLQLDEKSKEPLAGWSEFFFDKERDDWLKTKDQPLRGFYSAYPLESVKKGAVVLARFRDPKTQINENGLEDLPYLVTKTHGKGRTIYLGSGETWRLRQFRESFHERFWKQLARYAVASPVPTDDSDARAPELTPEQRKAIDRGLQLDWVVLPVYP
jgi:RNA polymerase sigma factor (sigma-70 family)